MTMQNVPIPVPPEIGATTRHVSWAKQPTRIILAVIGLFAIAYSLAWINSSRLADEFLTSAETAYQEGRYLEALTGYEEIDPVTQVRTTHGGFYQVTRLWGNKGALPKPASYPHALERIQEIIQEKLDITSAEEFIQMYTGREHPYFPDIYLRLGQLYEEAGDRQTAIAIYRECTELFPNRPDVSQAASEQLTRLGVTP
jgi:tetratricopeptide (TPR) repeat protein